MVILRKGKGRFAGRLPDGLNDLVEYNLITFKSHQQALDAWALNRYQGEGLAMPSTMEDFRRDFTREFLAKLTPEERLKGLTPKERLEGLSSEERVKGLSPQEVERLLKKTRAEGSSQQRKRRRRG